MSHSNRGIDLAAQVADRLSRQGIVDVDEEELAELTAKVYEILERAVGAELTSGLTPAQLDAFEVVTARGDDEAASAFLNLHVPHHGEVVRRQVGMVLDQLDTAIGAN